jgi:hypothetical protein
MCESVEWMNLAHGKYSLGVSEYGKEDTDTIESGQLQGKATMIVESFIATHR